MHTEQSTVQSVSPGSARRGFLAAAVLLGVFVAVLVIPFAGRATVCCDDFVWIGNAWSQPSIGQAMASVWKTNFFFRPIDIVANRLIDPRNLDLVPLLPVQLTGLVVLTAALWRLLRILGAPDLPSKAAATLWLWMHPATQLSVWSAGCSSQTWCAAAGLWTLCVVLGRRPGTGIDRSTATVLCGLSALGVIAKELFAGWAVAATVALIARNWSACESNGRRGLFAAISRSWPGLFAVLVPSGLWIGSRLLATRFGQVLADGSGGLYAIHGPVAVAKNAAVMLLGMFVQGPVHWARLLPPPWSIVPLVGAALSVWFAVRGSRWVKEGGAVGGAWPMLGLFVVLGLLAVWPTFGIGHVSELYVMGPNALIAALVGIGVTAGPAGSRRHEGFRIAAVTALYGIVVLGFVSRSYHFSVTWDQARALRAAAHTAVAAKPAGARVVVTLPESLRAGPMHSKYLVPPAVAAALPEAWHTERLVDPELPAVEFSYSRETAEAGAAAVTVNPPLRQRRLW